MPLDPNFAKQIEGMLAVATGLAHEGKFTAQQGRFMGTGLTVVIGVGPGAEAIDSLLAGKAKVGPDDGKQSKIIRPL